MGQGENRWNAGHYDEQMAFVSKLGQGVLGLLNAQPGERILDLGCGTGDLTSELARLGAAAEGMDQSEDMIAAAKAKYPDIPFAAADAHTYRPSELFDAVFSNAALHWMRRPEQVIASVRASLRPGGRFAAEFGGAGNVRTIVNAIEDVLEDRFGVPARARNPWYYPTIGEYASLLEQGGFRVLSAEHFDRPTKLPEGERGIRHWLDSFAGLYFADVSQEVKDEAYSLIEARTAPALCRDGEWRADYKRLRILAIVE